MIWRKHQYIHNSYHVLGLNTTKGIKWLEESVELRVTVVGKNKMWPLRAPKVFWKPHPAIPPHLPLDPPVALARCRCLRAALRHRRLSAALLFFGFCCCCYCCCFRGILFPLLLSRSRESFCVEPHGPMVFCCCSLLGSSWVEREREREGFCVVALRAVEGGGGVWARVRCVHRRTVNRTWGERTLWDRRRLNIYIYIHKDFLGCCKHGWSSRN